MKRLIAFILGVWILTAASGVNANIVLSATGGGSDKEILTGLTLGDALTFEYMFSQVTWAGQGHSYLNLNAQFINPVLGSGFNAYVNSNTGWLPGLLDTHLNKGILDDLAFQLNTFDQGNSGTVEIRNILIDGQPLFPVPEPSVLTLLGLGLVGLSITRKMKKA